MALLAEADVLTRLVRSQRVRLWPQKLAEAGTISLLYPSRRLLPVRTRAFIDFLVECFQREELDRRLAANLGAQGA